MRPVSHGVSFYIDPGVVSQWLKGSGSAFASRDLIDIDPDQLENRVNNQVTLNEARNNSGFDARKCSLVNSEHSYLGARRKQINDAKSKLGLPWNRNIVSDEQVDFFEDDFAKGNCASVSKVYYRGGSTGVFKPSCNTRVVSMAANAFGINGDGFEAKLANRSVLFSDLDQLLQIGVTPRTVYALHGGKVGCSQAFVQGKPVVEEQYRSVKKGLEAFRDGNVLLDIFNGDEMYKGYRLKIDPRANDFSQGGPTPMQLHMMFDEGLLTVEKECFIGPAVEIDFSAPDIQKRMADVHVLDFLAGSVDRNPTNILYKKVEISGEVIWQPWLIDNEYSFASHPEKSELLGRSDLTCYATLRVPRQIDADTAQRFMLTDRESVLALARHHGLDEPATQALLQRHEMLRDQIERALTGKPSDVALVKDWQLHTFHKTLMDRESPLTRAFNNVLAANLGGGE
ncbi:hypothetical protein [Endozoicomonas arenosclerae]|uniref:hypothetical protein n=1 Tax=Endozoicomonas arenosclerae TaxID=1633495 RepID=UPI000783D292|nr:hypothetical protein [Endozoicomonas arenosclerae]